MGTDVRRRRAPLRAASASTDSIASAEEAWSTTAAPPPLPVVPTPPAPGWWLAADGQWYPPQNVAQMPPPPLDARSAKASAKAAKAHSKALRPWYRKKRFLLPIGLVVVIAIAAAAGGGAADTDATPLAAANDAAAAAETNTQNLDLYLDRPDRQAEDHEAALGTAVRLSGYTATVTAASYGAIDSALGIEQVTVTVTVENRDQSSQPFNLFDWRIQTADGQVLDPTLNLRDDDLGSGALVAGGTVTGTVAFDVAPGTYYVIYKPDAFNAARGIWQITV